MSLIGFHKVLIATAILFCAGYAGWEARIYLTGGRTLDAVLAVVFALLAGGLVFYLAHLNRILGRET